MTNCKVCMSDDISQHRELENINYKGKELQVSMDYSACGNCSREFITKKQIIVNEARVRDAKKSADGLMTSGEIRHARVFLDLTQEEASKVFGGGKNAFSKYERGEVSQSSAMDKLIRVCLKHSHVLNDLLLDAGVSSHRALLGYENNIISYSKAKAKNQERFKSLKVVELTEVAYG